MLLNHQVSCKVLSFALYISVQSHQMFESFLSIENSIFHCICLSEWLRRTFVSFLFFFWKSELDYSKNYAINDTAGEMLVEYGKGTQHLPKIWTAETWLHLTFAPRAPLSVPFRKNVKPYLITFFGKINWAHQYVTHTEDHRIIELISRTPTRER